jgi:hypothetical protein
MSTPPVPRRALLLLAPGHELDRARPLWEPAGPDKFRCPGDTAFNDWLDAFVDLGVAFPFDEDQRLPRDLPDDLDGLRCIVIDPARRDEFTGGPAAERLARFRAAGGRVFFPEPGPEFNSRQHDVYLPALQLCVETALPRRDPGMTARLRAMEESRLMAWWRDSLDDQRRVLQSSDAGWAWGDPVGYHFYWPVFEAADWYRAPALLDPAWEFMRAGLDRALWKGPIACGKRFAAKYYDRTRDPGLLDRLRAEAGAVLPEISGNPPPFALQAGGWVSNEVFANCGESLGSISRITGDPRYLEAAVALGHFTHRCCFDPAVSLWLHRGHLAGPCPDASAHWGRGNGWMLYGVRGVLEDLPDTHPARPDFIAMLAAGLEGLLRTQGPHGLWHNVLTATEAASRQDSCGAWMYIAVYARAYWKGWLRDERIPPMCERAWLGLKTKLWRGLLLAQCCGTGCMPARKDYLLRAHTKFPGLPAMHAWVELQRMRAATASAPLASPAPFR